ncbi:MAG TPA: hypothetical protein VLC74_08120 [Rhizomicrobium sp.]|nr:hypothetical protein [Rhizomicrobium sp.]
MDRPAFGRRGLVQGARSPVLVASPAGQPRREPAGVRLDAPPVESVDEELRAWKEQRAFVIPWKQLSLMASICFGLASFVLPDSVGDVVDWLLYVLSAVSFYLWFSGRRERAKLRANA